MKLSLFAKIIFAAIAYVVIAELVNIFTASATTSYYIDPNYFSVWSTLMMPSAGPPPVMFFYYSIAFAFITGLIFSFVYSKVGKILHEKDALGKGLRYGLGLFFVAGIPFFLTTLLLINVPFALLVIWLSTNLIVYLLSGISIAKIFE